MASVYKGVWDVRRAGEKEIIGLTVAIEKNNGVLVHVPRALCSQNSSMSN